MGGIKKKINKNDPLDIRPHMLDLLPPGTMCACVRSVCLLPTRAAFWFSVPAEQGGAHEDGSAGVVLCARSS